MIVSIIVIRFIVNQNDIGDNNNDNNNNNNNNEIT